MDIFKASLGFISLILCTPLGEMISPMKYAHSRQLYFAYLAVFFTWVSCLTQKFGARKMSLQKFPRMTKKGYLAILFQRNTGVLSP